MAAKNTVASLSAKLAEVEALLAAHNAQLAAFGARIDAAQTMVTASAPKSAAVVYVDGKPFFTALTHSAAYKLMVAVKAKGHRSVYKPLH